MAARILLNALFSIDHQNGSFSMRCTRHHILYEFNMTGSINNDVIPKPGLKEYTRSINSD